MPQIVRPLAAALITVIWASAVAFAQLPAYYTETIAGAVRAPDGVPGTDMVLTRPADMVFDGRGGVLFAENGVRRLDANGIITTIAPYTASNIAVDPFRRVYISDQSRVYRIESDGSRTPLAGSTPETCCAIPSDNAPALRVQLSITGFTVAPDGTIYIAEAQANRIRKVDSLGFITTIAGKFFQGFTGDGGLAIDATLAYPTSLRSDSLGNLYFLDKHNGRIRRISTIGIITTVAGDGSYDNPVSGQGANGPLGNDVTSITINGSGELYWSESTRAAVWRLNPGGNVQLIAGGHGPGNIGEIVPATGALLNNPLGVAAGSEIWIADSGNGLIRRIDSKGTIRTVAGRQHYSGSSGKATQAQLFEPQFAITDKQGNTYISDTGNNRIRRVTPDGNIQTIAGTDTPGFSGDGGPATLAQINRPGDLAFDPAGGLVFADAANSRVRRINSSGTITTIAGRNFPPMSSPDLYSDGIPATDAFISPLSLAYDSSGNLYIAESALVIRKIDKSGRIFTLAGTRNTTGLGGDGQSAINTSIPSPRQLTVDSTGNVYVSFWDGTIRRIGTNGTINRIVGNGSPDFFKDGDSALGPAGGPVGLAVDSQGNLFFNDLYNSMVVRVINGRLYRIGGTGKPYNPTERPLANVPARDTGFFYPAGLSIDPSGGLVVADLGNHQIRRLALLQATQMQISDGNGQAGAPGSELPTPLRVLVTDKLGKPVAGVSVKFATTSAATVNPSTVITDTSGIAAAAIRLGAQAGDVTVDASSPGLVGVSFSLRAISNATGQAPAIRSVALAGAFGARAIVAPGAWLEIYGVNLAASVQQWSGEDFQAGGAPTVLQGVSIKINGRAAFISYVSPTQINVQAPDGPFGSLTIVQASSPGGLSNEFAIAAADVAPALLAPPSFKATKQYVMALSSDGTYAGPPGLIPSERFRRAKAADKLVLYGIGFGTTNPVIAAGIIAAGTTAIPDLGVTIGGKSTVIEYGGLAPGSVGLYQFNIVVPSGISGDQKLEMTIGTTKTQQELWLAIE